MTTRIPEHWLRFSDMIPGSATEAYVGRLVELRERMGHENYNRTVKGLHTKIAGACTLTYDMVFVSLPLLTGIEYLSR